jgi:hypothetical protein
MTTRQRTSHSYFVGSATSRRWKSVTPAMRLEAGFIPEPNTGCWLWLGSGNQYGYGRMLINRQSFLAHRVSYEIHKGPIPDGLELDHLCRVRCCVNPDHLEPVTHEENVRRGGRMLNTACPSGHPFSPENTWINPKTGWRQCRKCNLENYYRMKSRKEAA